MKQISIDFETYSESDIRKAGMHRYIEDSSFEILCLGWSIDFEEPHLWVPGEKVPWRLRFALEDSTVLIYAFNAGFEREIIKKCYKQFHLNKPPSVTRYRDTMALSCTYSYPQSLDFSAIALNVSHKKDKRGKYLINKLCKPKKWSKATPFTRWTPALASQDFNDLYEYCKQDVRAEQAVLKALPRQELTPYEQRVWQHTMIQNDRGVHIDYPLVADILEVLRVWKSDLEAQLSSFTGGMITTGGQTARMQVYALENKVNLPNMTAETVEKFFKNPNTPHNVRKILRFRQLLSKTSTAKFDKMVVARCRDFTVKGNLYYWGAITGRYGARGLQIQNLPRRKEKDPTKLIEAFQAGYGQVKEEFGNAVMELASKLIRACIIPKTGFDLIVSDYSSIENRVLHWCADDWVTLKEFEQGLDQYKTFAAVKYGVPYEHVNSDQRFHGKTAILGLGYQMGAKQYYATALSYGLKMTEAEAQDTVNLYRSKYKLIKDLWFNLYEAAKYCVVTGKRTQHGLAKFAVIKDHLFMKLPNGRCISYPRPRMIDATMPWGEVKPVISFEGVNPYSKKWQRLQIKPGRLTENLVQGISRDILVEGAINVEKAGYKVIGSVHDEIITTVKEGQGSVDEFDQLICKMPSWADGLPLKAKGYRAKRYRKE